MSPAPDSAERNDPPSRGALSGGGFQGQLAPLVHERLVKALGQKRAAEVMRDTITRLGGRAIDTPQDMLDAADVLIKNGGLVQAVGRSLKVQALLRGAVER